MKDSKILSTLVNELVNELNLDATPRYTKEDVLVTVKEIQRILGDDYNIHCEIDPLKVDAKFVFVTISDSSKTIATYIDIEEINKKKFSNIDLGERIINEIKRNKGKR
ncbi:MULTISPECIES: hypothetical protein [Paenibacillus]|uniref:hypothetical protein n=1 Tax=Paenibacillus TaxID=44249 RepID=UPI00096DE531|nr:hypothetical protein [Paenibacillus odorifer]OME13976.1 hypothetical protein BSK60_14070 [Paenibacillus odorifer]